MNFDKDLLSGYKKLIQTTHVRECYREFIRLFRYIRVSLEKSMPEYNFQGNITENAMDYSYFAFTNDNLKEKGLKIAVVFVHKEFRFQVWLCGTNRKYQAEYYEILKDKNIPFELAGNPSQKDYILCATLDEAADISDGNFLTEKIKSMADELVMFAETLQP